MKRIFTVTLTVLLLIGCGSTPENKVDEKPEVSENKEENKELTVEEINNQLKVNDFSYFAGEYRNNENDTFILQDDGNRTGFKEKASTAKEEDEYGVPRSDYTGNDMYVWKLADTEFNLGFVGIIYPIGVEVPELETDTSKIRISYGHDSPIDVKEVYYKVD